MSGIVGIHYLDERPVDRENLTKMVDILAHRGPDGADIWVDGCVGLGHRMLWTTPESLIEKLPLVNQRGDLVITADARIDNRDELIAALQINNRPADKIVDSELILAAYEKWGEDCPKHLLGDFAFAIWDERKQILFCARDHFGVKPFYYYSSNNTFVFGSEIKAIFCLPEVPRQINEVRIGDYLTSNFDDKTITFYQDILRLPPAYSLTVSHKEIHLQSYWCLDPTRELRLGSDEEYAAKFREIFTEAVRCRMRSAYKVGSMLSGGLDSSSITCTARNILSENGGEALPTFSAVFDEVPESDERNYINPVLAQGGTIKNYLHGDKISPLNDVERGLWHRGEPLFASNLYLNWGIYGIAQNQNVRVILDGFDGDNTVSHGVGYMAELALARKWFRLCQEMHGFAKNFHLSFWQLLWQYMQTYVFKRAFRKYKPLRLVSRFSQAVTKRIWHPPVKQSFWEAKLNPSFIQRINLEQHLEVLQKERNRPLPTQRHQHHQALTSGVLPYTLEILDQAAAAFAIELRYPFWDKRLVEFCLSLPANQKMNQGWTRVVMRRGMENILPKEVQWRGDKGNLAPSFDKGLLKFERERLEELLTKEPKLIEEYVNISLLDKAYQRFICRKASDDDMVIIWRTVNLSLWLKYTDVQS